MPLCFIATFTPLQKEEKKRNKKKKPKKLSQLLKAHISETLGVIWLKFEM